MSDPGPRGPCHICVSCHLSAWLVGVVSAPRLRPVSHVKQNQQQPKVAFRHRQHSLRARGGGHSRESNTHDTGGGALREHFLERLFFGRGASCEHGRAEGGWRGRGGARVCSRRPFRPHEPHTNPTAARVTSSHSRAALSHLIRLAILCVRPRSQDDGSFFLDVTLIGRGGTDACTGLTGVDPRARSIPSRGSRLERRKTRCRLGPCPFLSTDLKLGTGRVPRGTLPGSPKYLFLLGSYSTGGTGGLLMGKVLMTSDS